MSRADANVSVAKDLRLRILSKLRFLTRVLGDGKKVTLGWSVHRVRNHTSNMSRALSIFRNWILQRVQSSAFTILRNHILSMPEVPGSLTKHVDGKIVNALKLLAVSDQAMELWASTEDGVSGIFQANQFIQRALKASAPETEYFSKLKQIEERGLLKVLLTTYLKLLPDSVNDGEEKLSKRESLRIFNFVASLAALNTNKRIWSPRDLQFDGDLIHLRIFPVAARSINAIDFYARRIGEEYRRRKNINGIFVIAMGLANLVVAEEAARSFHQRNSKEFTMSMRNNYELLDRDGKKKPAVTVFLHRLS